MVPETAPNPNIRLAPVLFTVVPTLWNWILKKLGIPLSSEMFRWQYKAILFARLFNGILVADIFGGEG